MLPEYLSLELGATFGLEIRGDLHASLAAIQSYHKAWLDLYAGLARDHGLRIVAGCRAAFRPLDRSPRMFPAA